MTLSILMEEVEKVALSQLAPGPPAEVVSRLGPQLFPGAGQGIRSLAEFVDSLRRVEGRISDRIELSSRLRGIGRASRNSNLYEVSSAWRMAPDWYWADGPGNDDLSRAWDCVATTGYLEVIVVGKSQLVAVWPLWFALSPAYSETLFVEADDPIEFHSTLDYVTWASGMAWAWLDWNAWRTTVHGPVEEAGPFDLSPLRRSLARSTPLEDIHGFMDAMVIARAASSDSTRSISDWIFGYYSPFIEFPSAPRAASRKELFISSSCFAGIDRASATFEAEVGALARKVAPAALRRFADARSGIASAQWRDQLNTPWGLAALEAIADQFASVICQSDAATSVLGGWPSAGFGARSVGPQGATELLYGGWDLQFGDDDTTLTYGGGTSSGNAGGHVDRLVSDLRLLGFTAPKSVTPPLTYTQFDARVAMAVREFQIEASQGKILAVRGGVVCTNASSRRYLGCINGIVNAETRRLLQLWLELPRVAGDPPEMMSDSGLSQVRNALLVVACARTVTNGPTSAQIVQSDLWGPWGTPDAQGRDTFDFSDPGLRIWASDRLQRWGSPVATEQPSLAAFGDPLIPLMDVDVVPLGRHSPALLTDRSSLGGPSMTSSDHWRSTLLTLDRFRRNPRAGFPLRDNDWPVLFGMTFPETISGFADVLNAYDQALVSFGWCHWTLTLGGPGELGALLAWYRWRDPLGFATDFGSWGIATEAWPLPESGTAKHVAWVLMYGAGVPGPNSAFTANAPGAGGYTFLNHSWMRSWRTLYRILQAARRSDNFHAANREFAVRRIWQLLNSRWDLAPHFSRPVTLGELFTSQQSVVALMRWHINKPAYLGIHTANNRLQEALVAADQAYRAAQDIGIDPIDPATLADPGSLGAVAFQGALVADLVRGTGVIPFVEVRVTEAIEAQLPNGAFLSIDPGTYPGPPPAGGYP